MWIVCWLIVGITSTSLCRFVWRLSFKDRLTLGSILAFGLGTLLWPLSLIGTLAWFFSWAFDDYHSNREYSAVKWSPSWTKFRYKQHCFVRKIWHLGNPPVEEDWGWHDYSKYNS